MAVMDVRTPQEVAGGALQGAVNVDFNSPTFSRQIALLDPSKAYFVYCRSGMRSQQACELLTKQGFTTLYNLRGGLSAWPF